ncbi:MULTISPECIES: hypothetical protein [Roseiflexus]|uniref:hypothetical protein n=1 Tax=Roseiflexus TaxID=120961 RepID=UPI0003002CDE|nr:MULTISPECIES: hypothetical protein [Roseiflexus]
MVGGVPVVPGDDPWTVGLLPASIQDETVVFRGALINDDAPTFSSQLTTAMSSCQGRSGFLRVGRT